MNTEQPNFSGSENLGKFKDAESLLNAYNNLEAEFTRKSQRLKQLEEENLIAESNLSRTKQIEQDVEDFVTKFSFVKPFSSALKESLISNQNQTIEKSALDLIAKNYKSPDQLIADSEFLNNYVYSNSQIKDKIIKEYLNKLTQNNPVSINFSGNIPLTPPSTPKSIAEAGKLAKSIVKQK